MGHAGQPIEDIARQTRKHIDSTHANDPDTAVAAATAAAAAVDDDVAVDGMDADGDAGGEDGTAISRNGCTIVPAPTHAPSSSSSSSSDTAHASSLPSSSPSLTPLGILRSTWRWGHLCPTAPDTLPCYPYTDKEPFILFHDRNTPSQSNASASASASSASASGGGGARRVLFAGNQRVFESSLEASNDGRNTTLFVCVPR